MIIFPAIDVKDGQVVRLRQGDPNQQTIYGSDPVEVARRWKDAGASWLHMINLDGALDQGATLWSTIAQITDLGLSIQFGGGLRNAASVAQALEHGVQRAILGTAAVENPELIRQLVETHGADAVVVALDARHGLVATHGWRTDSDWTAIDLGKSMADLGVRHALYTDISRDGELEGVNVEATRQLAHETGLNVIASGGVRSIDDVIALQKNGDIFGVILGKALYEGLIDLAEAVRLASN